jgi:hypothetical protein
MDLMKFEVFMAVRMRMMMMMMMMMMKKMKMKMMFFWVLALFQRNILSPSLALKMETVCFSEMLTPTDKSTWCQNPEQQHHHIC